MKQIKENYSSADTSFGLRVWRWFTSEGQRAIRPSGLWKYGEKGGLVASPKRRVLHGVYEIPKMGILPWEVQKIGESPHLLVEVTTPSTFSPYFRNPSALQLSTLQG